MIVEHNGSSPAGVAAIASGKSSEEETPCDWTGLGKAWGEWSRKKWGRGRRLPNGRHAFPHLEMEVWRLIHTNGPDGADGPDGLATVTFQRVTVPTRRLQPTVTGGEVSEI